MSLVKKGTIAPALPDSKMVTGKKNLQGVFRGIGTPPQSPLLKPRRTSSPAAFYSKPKTPKTPRTPNTVRSSSPSSPLLSVNPAMSASMTSTGDHSPFSMHCSTAPVVGRHHKKQDSLIGFDPLLDNVPSTPTGSSADQDIVSNMSTSPPSPPPGGDNNTELKITMRPEDISLELQKIAHELASPRNSTGGVFYQPNIRKKEMFDFNVLSPAPDQQQGSVKKAPLSAGAATIKKRSSFLKRSHRRSRSVENVDAGDPQQQPQAFNEGKNVEDRRASTTTSTRMKGKKILCPSPPNSNNTFGTQSEKPSMIQDLYESLGDASEHFLSIPSLAKPSPTSFLTGREVVRSSEMEPSLFQMEIPPFEQFLVSSRLAQFVEEYRKEDFNLDLAETLVGQRRLDLKTFLTLNKSPPKSHLTDAHKPIVESLLEAADDVTIQGYVQQKNCGGTADSRREAVIFERQCQFVVVFRGTTPEQQGSNKSSPIFKMKKHVPLSPLDTITPNDPSIQVYDCLKSGYMDLESRVFACLDHLTEQNPFCDVVFSGHSFGGAMACLSAFRYAQARSTVRVSCQTFGAPKVGESSFRQSANSLPNLKVMRIEHYADQKCNSPSDGSHIGHSLVLQPTANGNKETKHFVAYKFDDEVKQRRPSRKHNFFKKERDASAYLVALEEFEKTKQPWVKDYYLSDGKGVRGKDNESRNVV